MKKGEKMLITRITYFVTLLSRLSNLDANYVMEEKFIEYRKNKENGRKHYTIHVYYLIKI